MTAKTIKMSGAELERVPIKRDNPDPRVPCVVLLDTSSSMKGHPIEELNQGYEQFRKEISEDRVARVQADVAVIEFNSDAKIAVKMQEGRDLPPHQFKAGGYTAMGTAINVALDLLEARKTEYKNAGVEYFRPWLVIMSDGYPEGEQEKVFENAKTRLNQFVHLQKVTVITVAIGSHADCAVLSSLSQPEREAVKLEGLRFAEFFVWLTASLKIAATTGISVSNDKELESLKDDVQMQATSYSNADWVEKAK